jgi:hypothetical protein
MAGTSLRVAAFIATVFLALCVGEARGQAPDSSSGAGDPAPKPAAPADVTSGSSAEDTASGVDAASADRPQDGGAVSAPEGMTPLNAPPEPASEQEVEVQPTPAPPTSRETAPGPSPTPDGAAGDPPAQGIDEKASVASAPLDGQASAVAASTGGGDPPMGQAQEPGATSSPSPTPAMKPEALEEVASPPAGRQPGDGLERVISDVRRELRSVQGQIDDLRHRLGDGAPPPQNRLIELRASLVRIAPMLVALEMRLDAAGRLSPHLRNLLRRVRSELRGARVTAAGLVAALRNSGARGAEVRLLLRELERFRAVASMLAANPFVARAPAPPVSSASAAYMSVQSATAASPTQPSAASPKRADGGRPTTGSPNGQGGEEPPPWAPAPGSATASPGGAFLFAGLASLAILLIGLTLPALRALLELLPGRPYSVAFLEPLERPG